MLATRCPPLLQYFSSVQKKSKNVRSLLNVYPCIYGQRQDSVSSVTGQEQLCGGLMGHEGPAHTIFLGTHSWHISSVTLKGDFVA